MTINFDAKPRIENYVPSIIHIDNTCRIQTVSKENSFLFELLSKFYIKTGCPMLLNTSLNIKGKPMVNDQKDAKEFAHKYGVSVY